MSSQILIFVELRKLSFFFHITANRHLQTLNLHFSNRNNNSSNNNNNNNNNNDNNDNDGDDDDDDGDDDDDNRTQSILFKNKKELIIRQCARSMSVSHFLLSPFC